jgi:excisionase family DNA binding protein
MPDQPDQSDMIRPAEAARMLGVTTRTVANWTDDGKLHAIRLPGGSRRYRRADIAALAAIA